MILSLIIFNPHINLLIAHTSLSNGKLAGELRGSLLINGGAEFLIIGDNVSRIQELIGENVIRVFHEFNVVLAYGDLVTISKVVKDPSVIKVVPNFIVRTQLVGDVKILRSSGDEHLGEVFSWGKARVGGDVANKYFNLSGSRVIVAVLDTGISLSHRELRGKLVSVNPLDNRYPGGWIEFDRKGTPICSTPRDTHYHGTWVSSILAGNYVGIAPNAMLMHALVLHGGEGTAAQVLAGLEWALSPYSCTGVKLNIRPDIVSLSLGAPGNYSDIFLTAISKLIYNNITVVAAIGNEGPGSTSNPGNIWGVIGVGALARSDHVSDFSSSELVEWPSPPSNWPFKGEYPKNYVKPDFIAPGELIPGAYVIDGYYLIASGTSASAPLVAGVIALIKEACKNIGKEISVNEVYDVLNKTSQKVCDIGRCGWGVVNAVKAVSYVYGTDLKEAEVDLNASNVKPLEGIKISSKYFMKYFIDGYDVGEGTSVITRVPLLDMGYHFIHSIGEGFYGYIKFHVNPYVAVSNKTIRSGDTLNILVSGFPSTSDVLIYLNNNLLTYTPLSLLGSRSLGLIIPYVIPGTYILRIIDTSGLVTYEEELNVSATSFVPRERSLKVTVLAPELAYVNEPINVYVIATINDEPYDLDNLSYRFIARSPAYVSGPYRVSKGIYQLTYIATYPGTYLILFECVANDSDVLRGVSTTLVKVINDSSYTSLLELRRFRNETLAELERYSATLTNACNLINGSIGLLMMELNNMLSKIILMNYITISLIIALLILLTYGLIVIKRAPAL